MSGGRHKPGSGEDSHAPRGSRSPLATVPSRVSYGTDEIELSCPGCTLEIPDGRCQHDRSCIFARQQV